MLARYITAELRRMGKQYPALEALLPTMTEPQLRDLLNALRDSQDAGKRGVQARARRMGFPPGVIR
jgi:hypothetical protein